MKYSKTRMVALVGVLSYVFLIAGIIGIFFITNGPMNNLIRGHRAEVARLLTVLVGAMLETVVLQSALYIIHHRFPVMTVPKYLFFTFTSFLFPWLHIYTLARKTLSVEKVVAFIRNRYYASACSEGTESTILIAHNSGDITVCFCPDQTIYLFVRMEDPAGIAVPPPESAWVLETSQDGIHQALVCRLSIHSGITELEAAQKITKAVDQISC